jgi:hypothetical protein
MSHVREGSHTQRNQSPGRNACHWTVGKLLGQDRVSQEKKMVGVKLMFSQYTTIYMYQTLNYCKTCMLLGKQLLLRALEYHSHHPKSHQPFPSPWGTPHLQPPQWSHWQAQNLQDSPPTLHGDQFLTAQGQYFTIFVLFHINEYHPV